MTNYVDEMMKTAGVVTRKVRPLYCDKNQENIPCEFCIEKNGKCLSQKETCPDFTAKKQLEIIKLILKSDDIDELNQYYSEIRKCYVFNALSLPDELGFKSSWTAENKNYDLALAELVVMLMNADELDKEKVREVLEGC